MYIVLVILIKFNNIIIKDKIWWCKIVYFFYFIYMIEFYLLCIIIVLSIYINRKIVDKM